jgi:anti-sigma B factor antagonist
VISCLFVSQLNLITTEDAAGWRVMAVEGEVDLATVEQLEAEIKSFLNEAVSSLAIDLTPTGFMDSTGLKCLVESSRSFGEAKRRFALIVSSGPISRLIDLSGINSKVTVVESVDQLPTIS